MAKAYRFYRLFREMKEDNQTQERDRFIFDLVQGRSSEESDRIKSLDGKASRIIAISGIVLSLETGFISILLNYIPKGSDFYVTSRLLLITSFIFLVASIAIGLRAYAIKTWKDRTKREAFNQRICDANRLSKKFKYSLRRNWPMQLR